MRILGIFRDALSYRTELFINVSLLAFWSVSTWTLAVSIGPKAVSLGLAVSPWTVSDSTWTVLVSTYTGSLYLAWQCILGLAVSTWAGSLYLDLHFLLGTGSLDLDCGSIYLDSQFLLELWQSLLGLMVSN